MLSYIFVIMIVLSVGCSVFTSNEEALSQSIMDGATSAVELMITMCGMMCLWSGIMEVAKSSGLTQKLSKLFAPLLKKLFPDVDKNSRAFSYICMNVSANLLGLANAATPLGLCAMRELKADSDSDVATDSMITFVVINTASIQLLPTTIAAMRGALGSKSPFDIVFCVLVSSIAALAMGLLVSKIFCKLRRKNGFSDAVRNSVCSDLCTDKEGQGL